MYTEYMYLVNVRFCGPIVAGMHVHVHVAGFLLLHVRDVIKRCALFVISYTPGFVPYLLMYVSVTIPTCTCTCVLTNVIFAFC